MKKGYHLRLCLPALETATDGPAIEGTRGFGIVSRNTFHISDNDVDSRRQSEHRET